MDINLQGELLIQIRDLHKSFGSQVVLDGITLQVCQGETVAVMGRSGTGKSILLKILIGLESLDSGSVVICGQNLESLDTKALNEVRKKVGFLFQQGALYDSMTIEENVLFPMARHGRKGQRRAKKPSPGTVSRRGNGKTRR